MAQLSYNGEIINSTLADIDLVGNHFELLATDMKAATTKIISARGFTDYIGGLSVDSFSSAVEECKNVVDELIHTIRQQQIMILSFSDDGEEIKAFLASLSRKEFDELDFSALEKYITVDVKAGKILSSSGATIATFGVSLVEGVLDFVETAADLVVMAGTAIASIFTGLWDLFTGSNVTEKMWEGTKTWVADKKVEHLFDSFYANTTVGRWMKDNAYGYDTVRGIGKGVGYTAGVVAVTVLTFGAGGAAIGAGGAASAATTAAASGGTLLSAAGGITAGELAVTAGAMGVAGGAEDAWADGATVENGLKYGIANGVWEGAQWYVGGKIAGVGSGASGVAKRVALDTADAGLEGFAQPALTTIYKDYGGSSFAENYSRAFESAGGWKNVATQAAIGAVASTAGEIGGVRKLIKDKKASVDAVALGEGGAAAAMGAGGAEKLFKSNVDPSVKVDVSGKFSKNVDVASKSISENIDNSSKAVAKNADAKVKSAKAVATGEGAAVAALGADEANKIFKNTTDSSLKSVDASGNVAKSIKADLNARIYEMADDRANQVFKSDMDGKYDFLNRNKSNHNLTSHVDSVTQKKVVNTINERIRRDGSVLLEVSSSKKLTSSMLENVDDLSKLEVKIAGGFADLDGNLKTKYNTERHQKRITYTGSEAYSILKKMEELESRIDMSLPTTERAKQIYEMIANEYSYLDVKGGHDVTASLRGITSNNALGNEGLVCAGYAQLYKELCDRAGIKCEYIRGRGVSGAGKSVRHAWNVVIGTNGEQIPVDVTWKSGSQSDWFGPSQKFADTHIADANEVFKDYAPKVRSTSPSNYVQ